MGFVHHTRFAGECKGETRYGGGIFPGVGLAAGLARLLPLERPVYSYLAEQVDGMIQLEFSRALSVSAGTAWGLWLIFVGLSVAALKKSSRKFEKKRV